MHDEQQKCENSPQTHRILLADDDADFRHLLALALRKANYEVEECFDGWDLLRHVASYVLPRKPEDVDLIISDIRMPKMSGLKIIEELGNHKGYPPTILITAFGNKEIHEAAKKAGVAAVLDKPFEIDVLLATVEKILA